MTNYLRNTINWYDTHAEAYNQQSHTFVDEKLLDEFCSFLPPNSRVLDAGCGGGRDSNQLAKRNLRVIGLDMSAKLLELARKNYPTISFVQGDLHQMQFADNSFEGIFANASLVHVESLEEFIEILMEFKRVLVLSGVGFVKVKQKTQMPEKQLFNEQRQFFYFLPNDILSALDSVGLQLIRIESNIPSKSRGKDVLWIHTFLKKL